MSDNSSPSATTTTSTTSNVTMHPNSNPNVYSNQAMHNMYMQPTYNPTMTTTPSLLQEQNPYILQNNTLYYPSQNVISRSNMLAQHYPLYTPQSNTITNIPTSMPTVPAPIPPVPTTTPITTTTTTTMFTSNETVDKSMIVIDISSDEGEDDLIIQAPRKKTARPMPSRTLPPQSQLQAPFPPPPPPVQPYTHHHGGTTIDNPISLDDEEELQISERLTSASQQKQQKPPQQSQQRQSQQIPPSLTTQEPVNLMRHQTSKISRKPQSHQSVPPLLSQIPHKLSTIIHDNSIQNAQSTQHQTKLHISKFGQITLQTEGQHMNSTNNSNSNSNSNDYYESKLQDINKFSEEIKTDISLLPSSSQINRPIDNIPDVDGDDDNDSVSSSELVFGAAPIPTEIDINLLDEDFEVYMDNEEDPVLKPDEMIDMDMKTPEPSMKTQIPKNINLDVLLSTIEVYDTSVIGPLGPNSLDTIMTTPGASSSSPTPTDHYLKSNENEQPMKMTRTSKRSSSKRLSKQASIHGEQSVQKPYVPWIVWQQVTWEDWAQLEVGDWLHWPFESWEVTIMEDMMKSFRTKGKKRRLDDIMFNKNAIWESIALKLPGRRAIDCSRFWEDKINNRSQTYRHPVIISCQPRDSKRPSKYELVKKSRYDGKPRVNMNKMAIWSDLKCKLSFGDGSADTLAVQILNKKGKWIKVIAASACNDQPEYNMPGNLRIWSAKNKRTVQLRGHRTSVKLADGTDQDVWHTITDVRVSNDQKLIFTSSHDKYTKIWDGTSGKMLSTLAFHEKKVHQLAVCPDTRDYILASGSADGTAVIWKLNGSGKIGDGIVCTPDSKLTKDPSIDTLVFGRGPSKGILYTGVSSGLASPMGFIQGYDIQKGKTKIYYKNMNGAVCDIDVSKTGRYIISGNHSPFDEYEGDGYVHINDTRTPESIIKARTGHPDVNLVRMSPCERYVASGSPNNETIVLDIRKPDRPLFSLKHQQSLADHLVPINSDMGISGIHWMADSRILVTGGGDCSVKLWDIFGNGELIRSYPTSSNISSLAVDETAMIICAGVAGAQGIVHMWSASPL